MAGVVADELSRVQFPLTIGDVTVHAEDAALLAPPHWFNDTLVGLQCELLRRRYACERPVRFVAPSIAFLLAHSVVHARGAQVRAKRQRRPQRRVRAGNDNSDSSSGSTGGGCGGDNDDDDDVGDGDGEAKEANRATICAAPTNGDSEAHALVRALDLLPPPRRGLRRHNEDGAAAVSIGDGARYPRLILVPINDSRVLYDTSVRHALGTHWTLLAIEASRVYNAERDNDDNGENDRHATPHEEQRRAGRRPRLLLLLRAHYADPLVPDAATPSGLSSMRRRSAMAARILRQLQAAATNAARHDGDDDDDRSVRLEFANAYRHLPRQLNSYDCGAWIARLMRVSAEQFAEHGELRRDDLTERMERDTSAHDAATNDAAWRGADPERLALRDALVRASAEREARGVDATAHSDASSQSSTRRTRRLVP